MHFDPTQFIGLTGIPLIEQAVQFLKIQFRMPTYLAPIAALIVGVFINVLISLYLHTNVLTGTEVGLLAGFSSSFWHELSK